MVYPETPDLMSYCDPVWISDYHFDKMIQYRLTKEKERLLAAGPSISKSLLLWGGLSEEGGLYLEPAFAVDAPASLPREGGPYRLEGHDASGNALFEFNFAMGEIADGEGGRIRIRDTSPAGVVRPARSHHAHRSRGLCGDDSGQRSLRRDPSGSFYRPGPWHPARLAGAGRVGSFRASYIA